MKIVKILENNKLYFDTNITIYLTEGFEEYKSSLDVIESLLSNREVIAVTS